MIINEREMHAPWLHTTDAKALDVTAKFYKHGIRGVNTSQSIGRMSVMQNDPNVPMMCIMSHPHLTITQMFGEETMLMPNRTQAIYVHPWSGQGRMQQSSCHKEDAFFQARAFISCSLRLLVGPGQESKQCS